MDVTYISNFTIQMAAILFWQILTLKLIFQLGKHFFSNSAYSTYEKSLLARNTSRSFFCRNMHSLWQTYSKIAETHLHRPWKWYETKPHDYEIIGYQINVQSFGSCYSIYVKIHIESSGLNYILFKLLRWSSAIAGPIMVSGITAYLALCLYMWVVVRVNMMIIRDKGLTVGPGLL